MTAFESRLKDRKDELNRQQLNALLDKMGAVYEQRCSELV